MSQLSGLQRRGEELQHHDQHRGDHGHPHQVTTIRLGFGTDFNFVIFCRCSFDESHRQPIFLLGGIPALAELIQVLALKGDHRIIGLNFKMFVMLRSRLYSLEAPMKQRIGMSRMDSKLAVKCFPMHSLRLLGQLIFFMKNMATTVQPGGV